MTESGLTFTFVFLLGLCIGSFLNVCIWRIPKGESIAFPASRCPKCDTPIKPYDNIPVLGWILLGGKCRACRAPISMLYPSVELLTGVAFVGCVWQFGVSGEAAKWILFLCVLIVLFFTDIQCRILPDVVNGFGAGAGLAFSFLVNIGDGTAAGLARRLAGAEPPPWLASFGDAILGGTVVALGLWAMAEGFSRAIGRAAMGFGDVKMMAMMGTFLGLKKSFVTLLLGTILGSVLGVLVIAGLFLCGWKANVAVRAARRGLGTVLGARWALARRYQLPLGTFLAVGAAATVFVGDSLLAWYSGWYE